MIFFRTLLFLGTAALLGAGCYGKQLVRGPITTDENAREIAALREGLADNEERLVRIEALSEEEMEFLRTLRAEIAAGREEMLGRVGALEEALGESVDRVERMEGKIDRLRYRLGSAPAPPSPSGGEGADTSAMVVDPKPLFDAAYLDLVRGNYRAALGGFDGYLQAYPRSALADDALYWIGECYLAEGEPAEAAERFARIEREYPDSERLPAALLKRATCFLELGDPGEARKVLTRLVDEFPGSVEAPLAKEKLKETH